MRLIIWIKFENETVKYKAVFFFDLSISHKRFYMVVHVLFLFPSYHVLDKYYIKCENAWLLGRTELSCTKARLFSPGVMF